MTVYSKRESREADEKKKKGHNKDLKPSPSPTDQKKEVGKGCEKKGEIRGEDQGGKRRCKGPPPTTLNTSIHTACRHEKKEPRGQSTARNASQRKKGRQAGERSSSKETVCFYL